MLGRVEHCDARGCECGKVLHRGGARRPIAGRIAPVEDMFAAAESLALEMSSGSDPGMCSGSRVCPHVETHL